MTPEAALETRSGATLAAKSRKANLRRSCDRPAMQRARPRAVASEAVTCCSAHVVEAELELEDALDPAAVGAAVTVELCGHWEHAGTCRWPHNSAIDAQRHPARFRTLFVAGETDSAAVRDRIETTLRRSALWRVVSIRSRPLAEEERPLAERLLAGPRAAN